MVQGSNRMSYALSMHCASNDSPDTEPGVLECRHDIVPSSEVNITYVSVVRCNNVGAL